MSYSARPILLSNAIANQNATQSLQVLFRLVYSGFILSFSLHFVMIATDR